MMSRVIAPRPEDLPSTRALRRSALIAAAVALVLVIAVVLPAETGTDPTGIGRLIGLKEMGDVKREVAMEFARDSAFLADTRRADSIIEAEKVAVMRRLAEGFVPPRSDTTVVTVPARDSAAVRLHIAAKSWAVYSWATNRGALGYDIVGDSARAAEGWYHRYASGSGASSDSGVVVAKFDGSHGWHWTNDSDSSVVVALVVRGTYTGVARRR